MAKKSKSDVSQMPVFPVEPKVRTVYPTRKSVELIIAISVVLVIGAGVGWQAYRQLHRKAQTVTKGACSAAVRAEAAAVLGPGDVAKLQKVTDRIQRIPHYDQDANCLLPVVARFAYRGDAVQARLYYTKLEQVYDRKTGFATEYRSRVKTLAEVKPMVEHAESYQVQVKKNIRYSN